MRNWFGLIAALLFAAYSAYAAAFFAWVTATPLSADELAQAQHRCYGWLAALSVSLLICVVLVLRIVRRR